MSIAKRLKVERERLGLSQPQLGDLVKAGKTTVINWEKGSSAPDAVQLSAFAQAGADVLYILTNQRSKPVPESATLPPRQRALINSFEMCTAAAQTQLLQLAAMLAAGLSTEAHQAKKRVPPSEVHQKINAPVNGSVVGGNMTQGNNNG